MRAGIRNAVSRFYPNPSFEQVRFEAVANAVDAGATHVSILVKIAAFDKVDTLSITIADNGEGFTDRNFEKFCSSLEVDNAEHEGLGRLVFLAYFDEIRVISHYANHERSFVFIVFNGSFSDESSVTDVDGYEPGTSLELRRFSGRNSSSISCLFCSERSGLGKTSGLTLNCRRTRQIQNMTSSLTSRACYCPTSPNSNRPVSVTQPWTSWTGLKSTTAVPMIGRDRNPW